MVQILKNMIPKNIVGFSQNVCSPRTNLGLLLYHKKQSVCNRGMVHYA